MKLEAPQLEATAASEPESSIPASIPAPTPAPAPTPSVPPTAAPTQTSDSNPYDEILKLNELLKMGILTQEEFDRKKKQLLGL